LKHINKDQILASSSGWIASLLNFFPGLGTGYIYQRRWLPYFLTAGAVLVWFVLGIFLQGDEEPTQSDQLIGLAGLFFISVVTVIEANLAYRKSVKLVEEKDEK
tara:strand:- start:182 stop:493 length:312 start_codon:yes stop_codon:yes gene_type:complete